MKAGNFSKYNYHAAITVTQIITSAEHNNGPFYSKTILSYPEPGMRLQLINYCVK